MPSFFFPLLWLVPNFEQDICGEGSVRVHRRLWDVAIFDLYSLVAERHRLRLPAELMHVFLQLVNLEVEVVAETFGDAGDRLDQFRAMLCCRAPRLASLPSPRTIP
jgi:hypothetical protein